MSNQWKLNKSEMGYYIDTKYWTVNYLCHHEQVTSQIKIRNALLYL